MSKVLHCCTLKEALRSQGRTARLLELTDPNGAMRYWISERRYGKVVLYIDGPTHPSGLPVDPKDIQGWAVSIHLPYLPKKLWDAGWYVDPKYRGKGIAREMTRALVDILPRFVTVLEVQPEDPVVAALLIEYTLLDPGGKGEIASIYARYDVTHRVSL